MPHGTESNRSFKSAMLCVALRFVDSCLVCLRRKPTVHLVCGTFAGAPSHPTPSLVVVAAYYWSWSCKRYCMFWKNKLLPLPLAQKRLNTVFFSLMHPTCTLWFAAMPALASTKRQEGMQRGSELPRPSTWLPLVPSGMYSYKRIPYSLEMISTHVTKFPGKLGVSHF